MPDLISSAQKYQNSNFTEMSAGTWTYFTTLGLPVGLSEYNHLNVKQAHSCHREILEQIMPAW